MLQSSVMKIALQTLHSNQLCDPLEHCHHRSWSQLQPCRRGYQTCALCSSPCNGCDSIYWICITATMRPQCNGCRCSSETRPNSIHIQIRIHFLWVTGIRTRAFRNLRKALESSLISSVIKTSELLTSDPQTR